jgi:hypothetical protein
MTRREEILAAARASKKNTVLNDLSDAKITTTLSTLVVSESRSRTSKRRGPGRPPCRPSPPQLEMLGIVAAPLDETSLVELTHGDPLIFKSLFAYFRNIKSKEMRIRFSPTGVTMFTRDHGKTSRNIAHLDGAGMNFYYCKADYWVDLNREDTEKMFINIDKSFTKITIIYREDDRDSLAFILKDMVFDKESHYHFRLGKFTPDTELVESEKELADEILDSYPIKFTLTDKLFKKAVSDIAAYSDEMAIEKVGEQPLQFSYNRVGMTYTEVYRNPEKIRLQSSVDKNQFFHCKIKVANVKYLAAAMITEQVQIFASEDHDLLFQSAVDDKGTVLVVSTLVRRV